MKQGILIVHRWLGLLFGFFLLCIGGSGSILVFRHEIDAWYNPSLHQLLPAGRRLSYDSLCAQAVRKFEGNFSSFSFDIPPTETDALEITLSGGEGSSRTRYIVDIDPYSGKILREGSVSSLSSAPLQWVSAFHDTLHLGSFGMLIVAVAAIALVGSILTGLIYYRRNLVAALLFRSRRPGTKFTTKSVHTSLGVWSFLLLAIISFTGFWMVKGIFTRGRWVAEALRPGIHRTASIDSCLEASRKVLPGFVPDFVDVPLREGGVLEIDGSPGDVSPLRRGDASSVTFAPMTGSVLEVVDEQRLSFPANLVPSFWPLHVGNFGGLPLKFLYFLAGLTPGVLAITGFTMWRKRQVPEKK